MADPFPKIPAKSWSTLRSRAAASPTTTFTPGTVASLLGFANPDSALRNVVAPMRKVGLIDDKGALTARGKKWRVDATYPEACDEIVSDVYPNELASLSNADGSPNRQQVLIWFQHQGFGDSNARQMAATYEMIASCTLPGTPKPSAPKAKQPTKKTATKSAKAATPRMTEEEAPPPGDPPPDEKRRPDLHIDIQVHIGADADPVVIDAVFASMAKHIYKQ